jgi:hypothetical protein
MNRTPMKRRVPLDAKAGLKRKAKLRKMGARSRARHKLVFGPQAKLCHDMPCCVCLEIGVKQRSRTEAHHEPPRSRGGIDTDTLPLCRDHHRRRHDKGAKTFWAEARIDPGVVTAYMRTLANERIANGAAA